MADVTFEQVAKRYGAVSVIENLNLHVDDHELMVLVGPSGCGKSTALRMIAGLEEVSAGKISIGGRAVNNLAPKDRDIAMVFQNYALYPHMSVRENLEFGLKMRKVPRADRERLLAEASEILGLSAVLDRRPAQLSGGQRQRVALGRAIVRKPAVFLFDEPLSNLDAKLRGQMRLEIQKLHAALRTTSLYVTHDQVEAMTLGQRMIVMNKGRAEQIGTPAQVYGTPATTFVASFIGSPPMNLLNGQLSADGSNFTFDDGSTVELPASKNIGGGVRILGIRPEHLHLGRPGLNMQVELVEALGAELLVHTRCGGQSMVIRCAAGTDVAMGQSVSAGFDANLLHWFDPETTHRID